LFRKTFPEIVMLALLLIGMLTLALNILYVKADSPYLSVTYSQQVGGHISEDTTWTLEGGPYIVVEDVIVESDVTLTVEPGVVVKFASGTNLIIAGALVAEGNPTHPITFTSNSETPATGDWGSIKFSGSSDDDLCKISYAVMEYGTTAVSIESSAPSVLFCDISNNAENGISDSEGSPTISGCSISNNQRGILIGGADAPATVTDNNIVNNDLEGIVLKGARGRSGPLNISENTISFNGRNGITCDVSDNVFILGNIISNNKDCGISSNRLDMHIRSNMIKGNHYGIYVEGRRGALGQFYIRYNYICENTLYDFYNLRKDELDATYNWWGTSNEAAIQEHIYDYYDDHNVGEVFYKPYLVPPVAKLKFSPETPYAYESVIFDASASFNPYGSIINYKWNFDDANVTSTTSPLITHVYTTSDDYNVTLTVTDEFGLTDSNSTIVEVLKDDTPPKTSDDYNGAWHTADFVVTLNVTEDQSGVSGTYYRINNGPIESVSISGQPLISFESANNTLEYWSVDNVDNEEFPHKVLTEIKLDKTAPIGSIIINNDEAYTNSTSVTLTLTATDDTSGVYQVRYSNDGVWDTEPWEPTSQTKSWTLTSGEGIKTVYYQIRDTAGLISTFSDTIILDTSPPTGSILFAEDLTYTNSTSITLTLTADDATSGVAQMRFSNDNVAWTLWEAYSTSKAWTLTTADGTKTVYVQYRDNAGLISLSYEDTIILDTTKPTASAGLDQTVYEDMPVTFDGSASTDENGIAGYTWTFTDVAPKQLGGKNPMYLFSALGTYIVTLKVTDPAGNYAADTVIITVVDVTKPIANAGSDQTVDEDTAVTFDGSASTDENGIAGYTWTFTDVTAKTLTGENPVYTFNTPGAYTVTLNVTDADGNWATDTVVVTVIDITSPIANAGADQTVGEDTSVTFDASGSSDNVGIVSYEWDFGDGTTGTEKTPTHTYPDLGVYTMTLTVKDGAGNIGTDMVTVAVLLDTDGDGTPDVTDTDDDDDGMPDTWETENGLNPLVSSDGSLDPDGDGLTNLKEYQRGTNPKISDAEPPPTEAFALWVLGAAVAMIALAGALAFLWMRRK
jgi:PKD repeat protein